MTKKRILAIIIALLTLAFIFSGCGISSKNVNEYSGTSTAEQSIFSTITVEDVGSYKQTLIYDKETMVEYVYLWHIGSGYTVSCMLYNPDGTPKLYSSETSKLILVSTEDTGSYTQSLMYDSKTSVIYSCSWHRGSGHTTIQPLYNADGTLKLY